MIDSDNQSNLRQQILQSLRHWRARLTRLGGDSLYLFLSAAAFAPAAAAVAQGQPAGVELMMLLGGLGGNLLANVVQKLRDAPDEAAAMTLLQEALAQTPALQAELDALLAKLDVFITAQEALPESERAWFSKTLRTELEKRGNWHQFQAQFMAVGPGAQAIDNRGGLIIHQGNQSVIHLIQQARASEQEKAALRGQIGRYLAWVQDKYGTMELRGIERKGEQVVQLPLETIYVPLTATLYQRQARRHDREEMAVEQPVDIAMQQLLALDHRLIVTGGPGGGKTTVLLHIAWSLAQALAGDNVALAEQQLGLHGPLPLPIFIPLSTYALYLRELPRSGDPHKRTLAAYISHYLIENQASFDLPPDFFQQLLRQGEAVILLLDGLDEVPNETERVKVRRAIEDLVTGRENMRVVVTCRTAAYQGRTALGRGFREVQVKPLAEAHIRSLVEQAYHYIYRTDPLKQANKSAELLAGIAHLETERQQRVGKEAPRLVNSPLLVRLLLIVHYSERRRLPAQRAELYMKATDAMLYPDYAPDEDVSEQIGRSVGGSMKIHRDLMQHLAFHMHQKGEKQGREVSEATLRQIMAQEPLYADMVDDLIALTRVRGTLLEERMGTYRFLHLAFQEYLAARYLAEIVRGEGGVPAIAEFLEQGPLLDSWWREVALLTPGYLMVTSAPTAQLLLQRLAGLDKEAAVRKLTADVALAAVEVAATAFWEWGASRPELQELQREISQKLVGLLTDREQAVQSKPTRRAAVGVALARLGDMRPEVMMVDGMQFCYVPPGPFWMGSDAGRDNEKPQHWVEMPHPYWLGRFPVTNAQYALFVEEGGYATGHYWPEAKAAGVWHDGRVEGFLENKPRNRPAQFGHPFDLPNHPMVGVTWYEALAYTRWLTARWREWLPAGWAVRLPTEAEWEKAAQGSGQVPAEPVVRPIAEVQVDAEPKLALGNNGRPQSAYIWGSEAEANRANYKDSGIGTTSAVGCFPGGASPYGVEEMAGNMWEWVNSKDKVYEYRADDGREAVDASGDGRVLRGGSFSNDQDRIRCAFRLRDRILNVYRNLGFRVCASPFLS